MKRNVVAALAAASLAAGCGGKVEGEPDPKLEIVGDATALAFGNVLAGAPRALDIRLTNQASETRDVRPLTGIAPGVEGAGLSVAHDCPGELDEGESCTLTVTAAPVAAGSLAGTFRLASNADLSPQTLAISGTAVAAFGVPQAAFAWATGASGAFANTKVGETRALAISVVNRGNAPGTVSLAVAPAGGAFTVASDCTGNIAAGASCTATVTFAPTEAESVEADLTLSDAYRQGYAPLRLALTGRGTD